MRELLACDGPISGEHLISRSVIKLLQGDGEFQIAGMPWLPEGERKVVGPSSLTANCLCQMHNSRLHPLDDAAAFLVRVVKESFEKDDHESDYIISGHDLERWLLKTVKVMAASQNLTHGRERLTDAFPTDVRILEMLESAEAWSDATGLYCVMRAGDLTAKHNHFQIAPLTNIAGEICGVWTNIIGLSFILLLEPSAWSDLKDNRELRGSVYRPGSIAIHHPHTASRVSISWADGKPHGGELTLKYLRNVSGH